MTTENQNINGAAPKQVAKPICAQRIAHRTRQLISTPDWAWRHSEVSDDAVTVRAVAILRADYRKAAQWLRHTSDQTPDALPAGNGINGPWHLVAHVTPSGNLGIVNVAHGRATEYAAKCPAHVVRFADRTARAQTHNEAGGSGGRPQGWRQIMVILGGAPDKDQKSAVPAVAVIYGLSTCYGTVGVHPSDDFDKYPHPIEIMHETTEPQREEVRMNMGVQKHEWEAFIKTAQYQKVTSYPRKCGVKIMGGNYGGDGDNRLQYVYVTGVKGERLQVMRELRAAWRKWIAERAAAEFLKKLELNGFNAPNPNVWAANWPQGEYTLAVKALADTAAVIERKNPIGEQEDSI